MSDLKLYWLTRQIKGLKIDTKSYTRIFQSDFRTEFGSFIYASRKENLLDDTLSLTLKGMYFADSLAGLLAEDQIHRKNLRSHQQSRNDSRPYFMG